MRVFFAMRHLGSFRLYESVVRELAARGHDVHLALDRADALGWEPTFQALRAEYPTVTCGWLASSGSVFWSEVGKTIRLWADYLRYLQPAYAGTPRLRARAAALVPPRLVDLADGSLFAPPANRRRLAAALRHMERALPPVPEVARQLAEARPDVVLITPLVYLGTPQFELLRAALAQGLRTAYCVASWDHLSSKALVRDMPHRVFVWNETQRREAIELHGVPPDRVVVTGAQCFDQWFGRRPSRSREQFCAAVGLPADRPLVLYVCSALFPGSPSEAELVRDWLARLRGSAHPVLRGAAVLVRPHPQRLEEWRSVDLSELGDVAVHGSNPVDAASKDDYFDALFHSRAVVGLNTTAFIEAAIVGRPVHTMLLPAFADNQEGTLHFGYLMTVGGGLLRAGRGFDEHFAQLAASLERAPDGTEARFVREFIRPLGDDLPATAAFCDAVEALARTPAPAPVRPGAPYTLLRWTMHPALRVLRRIYGSDVIRDDLSRGAREQQERQRARALALAARARVLEQSRREKDRRRREKLAARTGAEVEAARARERARAEKERLRQAKARDKAARVRQRDRAALRARIKRAASRWLRGERQAT